MQTEKATTLINTAVIVVGSYHVPASSAFGAFVGASLFILSQKKGGPVFKAWLFAVSFFSGLFGYDSAENVLNWALPGDWLHINAFTAAALFSALIVVVLQNLIEFVAAWPDKRHPKSDAPEQKE